MEGVCHRCMFPLTKEDCSEFPLKERDCSEYSSEEDYSEFPSEEDYSEYPSEAAAACDESPLKKEDCSESYYRGVTPLMHAAGKGYEQCVKDLVAAGADVNQSSNSGDTPLMWAARNGRENCLKELIAAGADVNLTDDGGDTALSSAIIWRQKASFMELVKAGVDVNKAGDKGKTPLMYAAIDPMSQYDTQYLDELIQAGADVNYANRYGDTALTEAVNELSDSAMILIDAGADMKLIMNHSNFGSLFTWATLDHYLELLKKFLVAGLDVNKKLDGGGTPLMWAAGSGQPACLQELIKSGADLNRVDYEGSSALIITVERQRETFDHLLKAGANVNIVNSKGETALTMAAAKENVYMAKHLRANCRINKMAGMTQNALSRHLNRYFQPVHKNFSRLLFAAGERLDKDDLKDTLQSVLQLTDVKMQLKHLQRSDQKTSAEAGSASTSVWEDSSSGPA